MDKKNLLIGLLAGVLVAVIGIWIYTSNAFRTSGNNVEPVSATQLGANTVPASPELKTGVYALEGYASSLSSSPNYRGTVTIVKTGEVYKLECQIGRGQIQRGVGILDGSILSVSYIDVTGGRIQDAGAVSYSLLSGGKLEGKWTSIVAQETGREVLTWQSSI